MIRISKHKPSAAQGHFEFSMHPRHAISLTREHPYEAYILKGLAIGIGAVLIAYLYFVAASVLNVIARKEALAQSTKLQGSIGSLEQKYFALSQDVTPTEGAALGMTQLTDTHYVYRSDKLGAAVTRNEI